MGNKELENAIDMERYFIPISDLYANNLFLVRKRIKHIVGEYTIDE